MKFSTPTANRFFQYFVKYREIPTKTALKVTTSAAYQNAKKEVMDYLWGLIPVEIREENQ